MIFTPQLLGFDKVVQGVKNLRNQVPFATSRAINTLGWMVQTDTIKRLLPSRFTLRTDWWKPGRRWGVNLFKSHKSQWPVIQATVDTQAPFMQLQETGGQKIPKAGHRFVAVPTKYAWKDRSKVIPYHSRYSSLIRSFKKRKSRTLSHGGDFWVNLPHESGPVIAVRGEDGKVHVMYRGKSSVKIKKRFGFMANANAIVDKNREPVFETEFRKALATAFRI